MSKLKFLQIGYLLSIIGLFFYSFTQIDLGLTLTQASFFQGIQHSFQRIGYFERPLATYLFIGVILFLYFFYILILKYIKEIPKKQIWKLIFLSALLLACAYNAFSYDLFNYIFDAKIFTYYGQNPYEHKALDFYTDPMLGFMHWTHRVYPYGPVWLGLTIPLSYLGFQFFLVTFFLFKGLMLACFLGTVWCIGKIVKKITPAHETFALAFFALNPFVLIESLVSAHNDIVMIFFIMLSMYFLVHKKYITTFFFLVISYGIKFASPELSSGIHIGIIIGLAIGVFIFSKIQKSISWSTLFTIAGCIMIVPVIFASIRTNFQPWYLLGILPFVALISHKMYITIPVIILSFFVLGEYIPFLFLGNWDPPVPTYLFWIRIFGIITAFIMFVILFFHDFKHQIKEKI